MINSELVKRLPDLPEKYRWRVEHYNDTMYKLILERKIWLLGWSSIEMHMFYSDVPPSGKVSMESRAKWLMERNLKGRGYDPMVGVTKE